MSTKQKVVVEVDPADLRAVIGAARKAVDQGRIGTDGEEFDIVAAIGAVDTALRRGEAA